MIIYNNNNKCFSENITPKENSKTQDEHKRRKSIALRSKKITTSLGYLSSASQNRTCLPGTAEMSMFDILTSLFVLTICAKICSLTLLCKSFKTKVCGICCLACAHENIVNSINGNFVVSRKIVKYNIRKILGGKGSTESVAGSRVRFLRAALTYTITILKTNKYI